MEEALDLVGQGFLSVLGFMGCLILFVVILDYLSGGGNDETK
jgi:hypothetical protein